MGANVAYMNVRAIQNGYVVEITREADQFVPAEVVYCKTLAKVNKVIKAGFEPAAANIAPV